MEAERWDVEKLRSCEAVRTLSSHKAVEGHTCPWPQSRGCERWDLRDERTVPRPPPFPMAEASQLEARPGLSRLLPAAPLHCHKSCITLRQDEHENIQLNIQISHIGSCFAVGQLGKGPGYDSPRKIQLGCLGPREKARAS